ncbi:MAG TPA: hypothetical protein VGR26_08300 [Acidimicrobiales bacterium]|nr:hypothetical protein [Acidimicrobiales bacterium]
MFVVQRLHNGPQLSDHVSVVDPGFPQLPAHVHIMMGSEGQGASDNAGSSTVGASAKKSSVLLTLDAERSAAPTRCQPDRYVGAASSASRKMVSTNSRVPQ